MEYKVYFVKDIKSETAFNDREVFHWNLDYRGRRRDHQGYNEQNIGKMLVTKHFYRILTLWYYPFPPVFQTARKAEKRNTESRKLQDDLIHFNSVPFLCYLSRLYRPCNSLSPASFEGSLPTFEEAFLAFYHFQGFSSFQASSVVFDNRYTDTLAFRSTFPW